MVNKKKNRSDHYQYLLLESPFSPEIISEFAEADSEHFRLSDEDNEALLDLKEELRQEFWRLVKELTPRQQKVIELYCQDMTQIEIAKELNVNQSSITKSLNGNCDYRNGKRIYGGSKRRLKKLAEKDPKVQDILRQISEVYENAI